MSEIYEVAELACSKRWENWNNSERKEFLEWLDLPTSEANYEWPELKVQTIGDIIVEYIDDAANTGREGYQMNEEAN